MFILSFVRAGDGVSTLRPSSPFLVSRRQSNDLKTLATAIGIVSKCSCADKCDQNGMNDSPPGLDSTVPVNVKLLLSPISSLVS